VQGAGAKAMKAGKRIKEQKEFWSAKGLGTHLKLMWGWETMTTLNELTKKEVQFFLELDLVRQLKLKTLTQTLLTISILSVPLSKVN
jgi:hypothetical protein